MNYVAYKRIPNERARLHFRNKTIKTYILPSEFVSVTKETCLRQTWYLSCPRKDGTARSYDEVSEYSSSLSRTNPVLFAQNDPQFDWARVNHCKHVVIISNNSWFIASALAKVEQCHVRCISSLPLDGRCIDCNGLVITQVVPLMRAVTVVHNYRKIIFYRHAVSIYIDSNDSRFFAHVLVFFNDVSR